MTISKRQTTPTATTCSVRYFSDTQEQVICRDAARIGGDEFLIFIRYQDDVQPIIARIFGALVGRYADFTISVSMGVSTTESVGRDYGELFRSADQALYSVKRSGRGQYRFYDESMCQMLSVISPIDKEEEIVENKDV